MYPSALHIFENLPWMHVNSVEWYCFHQRKHFIFWRKILTSAKDWFLSTKETVAVYSPVSTFWNISTSFFKKNSFVYQFQLKVLGFKIILFLVLSLLIQILVVCWGTHSIHCIYSGKMLQCYFISALIFSFGTIYYIFSATLPFDKVPGLNEKGCDMIFCMSRL